MCQSNGTIKQNVKGIMSQAKLTIDFSRVFMKISLLLACGGLGACTQVLGIKDLPGPQDAAPMSSGGAAGMGTPQGGAGGQLAGSGGTNTGGGAAPDGGVDAAVTNGCFEGKATKPAPPKSVVAFGGTGDDITNGVVTDGVNRIMVGQFDGTFKVIAGNVSETMVAQTTDAFLVKTDALGQVLWVRQMGGSGFDAAYAVATDANANVFVAGGFSNTARFSEQTKTSAGEIDAFVAKFSSSGALVWVKVFGGPGTDYALSIKVTSDGELIVTGAYEETVLFGTAPSTARGKDAFLMRMKANGDVAWAESFGDIGDDQGIAVAINAKDQIALQGIFTHQIDVGGGELTVRNDLFRSRSIFTTLRSSTGVHIWSIAMGGGNDVSGEIKFDDEGHLLSSGSFTGEGYFGGQLQTSTGPQDMFIVRISPTGNLDWARHFGGMMETYGYGVVTKANNVYIAGSFWEKLTLDGLDLTGMGREGFVAKLDLCKGNTISASSFGGAGIDEAYGLAVDGAGNVVISGTYEGAASFNGEPLTTDVGKGEVLLGTLTP